MAEKSELLKIPAFAGLPDDQLDWFLNHCQEIKVAAGDTYVRPGDPADAMFVLLEGQFQFRGEFGGQTVIFSSKAGDVTGVLPFSRMMQFNVAGRAVTDGRIAAFSDFVLSRTHAAHASPHPAPGGASVGSHP